MTFTIARNQIHIDWKLACTAVGIIISTTWGAAWFIKSGYDEYRQDQQSTKAAIVSLQQQISRESAVKGRRDSLQDIGIYAITRWRDSLTFTAFRQPVARPQRRGKFYTERWVNGHLVFTEIKPD